MLVCVPVCLAHSFSCLSEVTSRKNSSIPIYSRDLKFLRIICMCVGICMRMQVPVKAKSSGVGLRVGCEPPSMSAGYLTQVPWKSSPHY